MHMDICIYMHMHKHIYKTPFFYICMYGVHGMVGGKRERESTYVHMCVCVCVLHSEAVLALWPVRDSREEEEEEEEEEGDTEESAWQGERGRIPTALSYKSSPL